MVTQATIVDSRHLLPLEYPSAREYYEEIFDTNHYTYKKDWALNVMLIRWKDGFAERIPIGQLHADAWKDAHQNSKLITLV